MLLDQRRMLINTVTSSSGLKSGRNGIKRHQRKQQNS